MAIRKAIESDIPSILSLLGQVLDIHHNGRPDIFKAGAVKYTQDELKKLLCDPERPIFVYTNDEEAVLGYCFCIFKQERDSNILTDVKTLYIDDLCVDENARGAHIGTRLFDYVTNYGRENGFYNVTLNVWALNGDALGFYERLGLSPQKICMEKIL